MNITLRLINGWSQKVWNISRTHCDIDGARLWIGPGRNVYCDLTHN